MRLYLTIIYLLENELFKQLLTQYDIQILTHRFKQFLVDGSKLVFRMLRPCISIEMVLRSTSKKLNMLIVWDSENFLGNKLSH